jgi:hypothetical protein
MTGLSPRLALGTVQFGLAYGVSNDLGRPDQGEVRRILGLARAKGIDTLDTAPAYGDSEAVLGRAGTEGFHVISKVPKLPEEVADVRGFILGGVRQSLERLRLPRLHGLLLHDAEQLCSPRGPAIRDAVMEARALGLVEKIGLSIYAPDRLAAFTEVLTPQIVQAPFNILDQRLVASGWADRLKAAGVELHVRSAFLQGLLLFAPAARPEKFRQMPAVWAAWDGWLAATGLPPLEACLRFVAQNPQVDRIVVGVNSAAELRAIAEVPDAPLTSLPDWPNDFDQRLIDPSQWSSL